MNAPKLLTIGFTILGNGKWSGGINYLRNLLILINDELADHLSARLFITPDQLGLYEDHFHDVLSTAPIVHKDVAGAGVGRRALVALITGSDKRFAKLIEANNIDVMFENAQFFGNQFPAKVLSWQPDYQHRHLPKLFSFWAWWKREIGFRAQCGGRRIILLSSYNAENDCHQFYSKARQKTCVARFTSSPNLSEIILRTKKIRSEYDLPERFFYLPNQFWAHKNHAWIVKVLEDIAKTDSLENLPPIIMTGSVKDPRDPDLFDRVMSNAKKQGVARWFRHLGHIPFVDVLALNAEAELVINPSRFEGWASAVEEAKSLSTLLALSDIPIHREQVPDAKFFSLDNPKDLAIILKDQAMNINKTNVDPELLILGNKKRQKVFAEQFLNAIKTTSLI